MVSLIGNMPDAVASPQPEPAARQTPVAAPAPDVAPMIDIERVDFAYGSHQVLFDVTLPVPPRAVTAFIGPSGCGKTTLVRCFNRMNDLVDNARISKGSIRLKDPTLTPPRWTWSICAGVSAWFSKNRIPSQNRFMKIFPTGCASPE